MIDVESLSFSYVSELTSDRVDALSGVDLSARPGTLTLVCGSSGCGKSTLMRALTGLVPQMTPGELEGAVRIDGRDLAEVPLTEVGHLCSSVFQNPRTQFFCDTVAEELAFCGENYGRDCETLVESSARAATLMGISHLMNRKLSTLSGGQLQKVALACALASGAPVLLADEPTSNLDPDAIADVRRALAVLKEQGMTIVVVEHRLHFLRGLADQVLLMEGGAITRRWGGEEFYSMGEEERRSLGLRTLVDPGPPQAWVASRGTGAKASADGDAGLSCRDLSFAYGSTPVFEGFDADFPAGQITCIAGENGAGKTTLVRVLCGLAAPASGTITLDGQEVNRRQRRAACALILVRAILRGLWPRPLRVPHDADRPDEGSPACDSPAACVRRCPRCRVPRPPDGWSGGGRHSRGAGNARRRPRDSWCSAPPPRDSRALPRPPAVLHRARSRRPGGLERHSRPGWPHAPHLADAAAGQRLGRGGPRVRRRRSRH